MKLILGTSCHLPNGCGDDEAELLYTREIKPLISAVYQFSKINITVHYSGVLLNWIERKHPELIMLLNELLSRKQAELLGGGFYEPILPLLPQVDKLGQIEMLTTYLRKQFGRRPQGCWIPALAWEQNLVGPLNACGMAYTFLEDFRFAPYYDEERSSQDGEGGIQGPFYAPCITEDQGKLIGVFPLSLQLSNEFYRPGILKKLEKISAEREYPVSVFPRWTQEENSELAALRFFEELSNTGIEFTLPGRVYKSLKTPKRLYFNGGNNGYAVHPRQFLTAYPEANGIYTKMIYTHNFINHLRGDMTRKRNALEELWKAQDCGIFRNERNSAGIIRPRLRKAAYRALLEAEKISREKKKFTPSLSITDIDLDGEDEYLFSDDRVNAYVKATGAGLFEYDFLPASWNYLDIFLSEEKTHKVHVPPAMRRSFVEYLVPAAAGDVVFPADLSGPRPEKSVRFLGNEVFEVEEADRVKRKLVFRLSLQEEKTIKTFDTIEFVKTWQMKKSVTGLRYTLKNTGTAEEHFFLVTRLAFSFPGGTEDCLKILAVREGAKQAVSASMGDIKGLEFKDIKNEAVLVLESNRLFRAGIKPAASGGFYQFTEIFLWIPVFLEAGKQWETDLLLRISS